MDLEGILAILIGSILGAVASVFTEIISAKRKSKWKMVAVYWDKEKDKVYSVEKNDNKIRCYINGHRVRNDLVLSKGV